MDIIDDVAWSVKEAEFVEYSKFTVGKIGPKSGWKPKIYERDKLLSSTQV